MIKRIKSMSREIEQSSLAKAVNYDPTYEECRNYACKNIVDNLTYIPTSAVPFVLEIPKGTTRLSFQAAHRTSLPKGSDGALKSFLYCHRVQRRLHRQAN